MPSKDPEYHKKWYQANKKKNDASTRKWRAENRTKLILEFGGKCIHCGHDDPICLDFDHIANDGHLDSKKNIVFHVKDNPSRFQLLCKNCNWKKEYLRRQDAINLKETG